MWALRRVEAAGRCRKAARGQEAGVEGTEVDGRGPFHPEMHEGEEGGEEVLA